MPQPPIPARTRLSIIEDLKIGKFTRDAIARKHNVAGGVVTRIKAKLVEEGWEFNMEGATPPVIADKKEPEFDWREWKDWIGQGQKLRKKGSATQSYAEIRLGDGTKPVILFQLGDIHIGSWGSDHDMLCTITEEIASTPNLYVALVGDVVEMAIKMRSVLEVMGQILPPEQQLAFLESWLKEIQHKIAFSCWGNHEEREEKQSGFNSIKALMSKGSVYFNGIGHPDVHVGDQVYKFVVSHKYRGNSMYDATFGPKRYIRMEAHGREIALQGDLHRPAISQYVEGGSEKLAITSGTLQLDSSYVKRYFSLKTFPVFPCVVLRHDRHEFIPFWNLKMALDYLNNESVEAKND